MRTLFLLFALMTAASAGATDFKASVTIRREGQSDKIGVVEQKGSSCVSRNGLHESKKTLSSCQNLQAEILKGEKTYSNLPFGNTEHVASFTVDYKDARHSWSRVTPQFPSRATSERENLRKLAVKILDLAVQ